MLDLLAERVGHRRLGDPLAERARDGRPVRDRAAARSGRRRCKQTLLAVRDAYRSAPLRRDRLRRQEHRHRQRLTEYGRAILAARGRRHGHPASTRGPRWARACHTVLRQIAGDELGYRPGADPRRRRHRARARHRRDDRVAGDDARRPGGARRGTALRDELAGAAARGARRARVRGRVRHRLDDRARGPTSPKPVTHFAYGWATQVVILDDDGRSSGSSPPRTSAGPSTGRSSRARSRAASTWASATRSARSSSSSTACR